jgi:hypothetical protein
MQLISIMNRQLSYSLIVLFGAMLTLELQGCKPESSGQLGDPFNKLEGMYGIWELNAFSQTDLQNPLREVRDLSELYIDGIVTPMQVTLNEDRSYEVTVEKGKNYFGDMGIWSLDDETHPSYIIFESLDVFGTPLDTLVYDLGSVVRPHESSLDVVLERSCDDLPLLSYTFSFTRQ